MQTLLGGAAPVVKKKGFIKVGSDTWWNYTKEDLVLVGGYPTVANGSAATILVPAGKCAYRAAKGDASTFDMWFIGTYDEVAEAGADSFWKELPQKHLVEFTFEKKGVVVKAGIDGFVFYNDEGSAYFYLILEHRESGEPNGYLTYYQSKEPWGFEKPLVHLYSPDEATKTKVETLRPILLRAFMRDDFHYAEVQAPGYVEPLTAKEAFKLLAKKGWELTKVDLW